MKGKTIVVTGANSGIGKVMAVELARAGAHVVIGCRNRQKGEDALAAAREAVGSAGTLELATVDVSSLASVRAFATETAAKHPKIDVLINNAGVYLPNHGKSADGYESTMATNHVGPFLLTQLLWKSLAAAGGARVVNVSSEGHRGGAIDFDDLMMERGYRGLRQYCNSKLANILFTRELNRRGGSDGIVAGCFHPGAVASGFAQDEPGLFGSLVKLGSVFLRTPERGARTGVWLASSADPDAARPEGRYFIDERPKTPAKRGRDDDLAKRLWTHTEKLVAH